MRTRVCTLLSAIALASCSATVGCQSQRHFASPEEAGAALVVAVQADDTAESRDLFGPRYRDLRSDDAQQDAQDRATFRRVLETGWRFEIDDSGVATLLVGRDEWPFAVPLVQSRKGWRFDTAAGVIELENRRIGRNELRNIAACRTLIDAQIVYRSVDRDDDGVLEYTDRMMSSPGKRDGLHWRSPGGVDPSPIGPYFAAAAVRTDEAGERIPYYGYRYRGLMRQGAGANGGAMEYRRGDDLTGGWAVIAWPDEYDHTGVMTFLVSQHGVIYERDFGPDTDALVAEIDAFDPADGWTPVSP
jgi:hypothetical protein